MKNFQQALVAVVLAVFSTLSLAADGPPVTVVIPDLPANQEMLILEINLEPGQESSPHRHTAHVFVYVLEGKVNMQVAGEEMVTLSPGEMFYENPGNIHTVSQNASDTETAKFLVHMLRTTGTPVSVPVE
ncbi:MAG: cupin [SAR86 cluster bacterium]|uniref:Cupin n=1 Tax=SAR86 cluster bacterium TaxID=2030880 RepID=A0A2A4WZU5_9GAMM|nr:MAG: cupin [SAR86 cluster bacterium]